MISKAQILEWTQSYKDWYLEENHIAKDFHVFVENEEVLTHICIWHDGLVLLNQDDSTIYVRLAYPSPREAVISVEALLAEAKMASPVFQWCDGFSDWHEYQSTKAGPKSVTKELHNNSCNEFCDDTVKAVIYADGDLFFGVKSQCLTHFYLKTPRKAVEFAEDLFNATAMTKRN